MDKRNVVIVTGNHICYQFNKKSNGTRILKRRVTVTKDNGDIKYGHATLYGREARVRSLKHSNYYFETY